MGGREYVDYLVRTSRARVEHGRISRDAAEAALRGADKLLARARALMVEPHYVLDCDLQIELPPEEPPPSAEFKGSDNGDLMEVVSGQNLSNEVVKLDGKHFIDCLLNDCVLEYDGYPMVLESTEFKGCTFRFTGQAALTFRFLECFGLIAGHAPQCDLELPQPQLPRTLRPN